LKSIPPSNDNYGFGCPAIPKIVQSETNPCYLRRQFHALDFMTPIESNLHEIKMTPEQPPHMWQ
jgi:hypothetical protein